MGPANDEQQAVAWEQDFNDHQGAKGGRVTLREVDRGYRRDDLAPCRLDEVGRSCYQWVAQKKKRGTNPQNSDES